MTMTAIAGCDVLVVGAGIVGLAHAAAAVDRGLSVVVIDRDARAVGASVRNFGHACVTAQTGELLELAQVARERWLAHSRDAGFFCIESGALAVAQSPAELAVLEEFSAAREPGEVRLLSAAELRAAVDAIAGPAVVGAALLRDDLRVDPREAVGSLAARLAERGVTFLWRTAYLGAANGAVDTSRGVIAAARVIVCVGHDLDYLYPTLADRQEVQRCGLQMALVRPTHPVRLAPAVLTGTSMLRYPAFTATAAAAALRAAIAETDPGLLAIGANVMFTQRPDGTIIAGDSHGYDLTLSPFLAESTWDVLLDRIQRVLAGRRLEVVERWQGVYASSPLHPYLVAEAQPGVTAVAITSGVGMTISFGVAAAVIAAL